MGKRWRNFRMRGGLAWTGILAVVAILSGNGCATQGPKSGAVTYGVVACGGVVTDLAAGLPITGAQVVMYVDTLTEFGSPRRIIGSATTDHRGQFYFPANPFTLQLGGSTMWVSPCPVIRVSHPGYDDLLYDVKKPGMELSFPLRKSKKR